MQGANGYYAYVVQAGQHGRAPHRRGRRACRTASPSIDKGLDTGEQGRRRRPVPADQRRAGQVSTRRSADRPPAAAPTAGRAEQGIERSPMNISETFIRRPIATSLMMLGVLVFGAATYNLLPVAALPNVDFPTITVSATLPGASPETMASSVATPLEQQFAAIPGLASMNSTSGLGTHLDHPAVRSRPQHRRRRAGRADRDQRRERPAAEGPAQPADLPQGQPGRPRHPDLRRLLRRAADLQGRRLRLHDPGAEDLGGDRRVAGAGRRPAGLSPCACRSIRPRSPPRGIGLEDVRTALANATRQPAQGQPRERRTSRSRSTPTTSSSTPPATATSSSPTATARRSGCRTSARSIDGTKSPRTGAWFNGKRVGAAADLAPARRQHRRGRRHASRR